MQGRTRTTVAWSNLKSRSRTTLLCYTGTLSLLNKLENDCCASEQSLLHHWLRTKHNDVCRQSVSSRHRAKLSRAYQRDHDCQEHVLAQCWSGIVRMAQLRPPLPQRGSWDTERRGV